MTQTDDLTVENFTERTGRRFRVSREQHARIKAGTLTREEAFNEFLSNGGPQLSRPATTVTSVPIEVFLEPGLTIETFSDVVKAKTGKPRRFRVSSAQAELIKAGKLTREQAFSETVSEMKKKYNEQS